jgi:hypothetical protein
MCILFFPLSTLIRTFLHFLYLSISTTFVTFSTSIALACSTMQQNLLYIILILPLAVYNFSFFRDLYTQGLLLKAGIFLSLVAFWRVVFHAYPFV